VRVVAAGLFVFGGMLVAVALLGSLELVDRAPSWLVGPAIVLVLFALLATAMWLFNPRGSDPFGRMSPEEHIRELERLLLLESTTFRATRAFGIEEFEDEGLHYYLKLVDGRVLFLSGQYLYQFEPITDDPDVNQPRSFPCSEFTVRRHTKEGYVVDMICGGVVLEPEVMAPAFSGSDWREHRVPEDGQIITNPGYDDLKRERAGEAAGK
jgi:hypothetical protein